MKKIRHIGKLLAFSFLTAFIFSSCTEDAMDKVNENPNNPKDAPARLIVTDLGVNTAFYTVGGDFSLYASIYMEHEAGIHGQTWNAETRGGEPTTSSTYNNAWRSVYSTIKNAKIAIDKCQNDPSEAGNDVTEAIARIFLAYNGAVVADVFGDTPFSQTGILNEDGTPKYMQPKVDKQEDIYKEVQAQLDTAIILLDGGNAKDASSSVGSADLIYSGSAAKWLKAAYGLKARYTMRLINKSANKGQDYLDIIDYVSKSFTSADDEFKLAIYDGDAQLNPLAGFTYSREALAASTSLINKFAARNDPRTIQSFAGPDLYYGIGQASSLSDIEPAPNGTPEQAQSYYGFAMSDIAFSAPTMLMSYHELKFLEAEALQRQAGAAANAAAEAALKEAIGAAFENLAYAIDDAVAMWFGAGGAVGLTSTDADNYYASDVQALFNANPLKEIMVQKYLAFFGASGESLEAYNDYRRLKGASEDFIDLENPQNATKFPLRFGYGVDDVLANREIKELFGNGQYVYTEAVWWAGGTR